MRCLAAAVLLSAASALPAQTCNFLAFGRPCGGDLAVQQVTAPTNPNQSVLVFDATNLAPGAIAVLVMGQQGPGIQLPGSTCTLLVQRQDTVLAQADRSGSAAWRFPVPVRSFRLDFQVVTFGFTRNGRLVESTNGVTVGCR